MLRELAELGGLVDRVRDGAAAIRKLSSGKYEGVVLDLKLGTTLGPQGLSVLDELKRSHPDIAVVVVTAHPHLAVRALEIGVDALLYKPVEGSHVMQDLRRAVELRGLRRENAKLRERIELIPEAPGIVKSLQSPGPESRGLSPPSSLFMVTMTLSGNLSPALSAALI